MSTTRNINQALASNTLNSAPLENSFLDEHGRLCVESVDEHTTQKGAILLTWVDYEIKIELDGEYDDLCDQYFFFEKHDKLFFLENKHYKLVRGIDIEAFKKTLSEKMSLNNSLKYTTKHFVIDEFNSLLNSVKSPVKTLNSHAISASFMKDIFNSSDLAPIT